MSAAEGQVRCAVVVPTTGSRPTELRRVLSALAGQTYPGGLVRIIVVDDRGLRSAARGLPVPVGGEAGGQGRVTVVSSGGRGPAAARNAGVSAAPGVDLILFTDDDAVPGPGWIAAMVAAHLRDPRAALSGPVRPADARNGYSRVSELIEKASRNSHRRAGLELLPAVNLAVPAGPFGELGGFDERYRISEDRDLNERWVERRLPVRYCADAEVLHDNPTTLGSFWRTFVGYGRGAFRFHADRPSALGRGAEVFLTTLGTAIGRAPPRLVPIVGLWLVATLTGFLLGAYGAATQSRTSSTKASGPMRAAR